ncbi:MAG TPA: twin-arginine translocase TatA/TatE family subunit [Candidatus Acidoferrum sp.]|jgi:sec-independent protein translocase protein TatA
MGEFSPFHWLIVLAIILLLFGGRKIPELAKGLGEGIRNFKEGMAGRDTSHPPTSPAPPPVQTTAPVVAPPTDKPGENK